jgi:uncharacterized coiled-coil DUF342 family protein
MEPELEKEVRVKLTDEELLAQGEKLGRLLAARKELKATKDAYNERINGELKDLDAQIEDLGQTVRDGHEMRKQGDLFHDNKALHDVAKTATKKDDAFGFDGTEPPDKVVRTHAAIDVPK